MKNRIITNSQECASRIFAWLLVRFAPPDKQSLTTVNYPLFFLKFLLRHYRATYGAFYLLDFFGFQGTPPLNKIIVARFKIFRKKKRPELTGRGMD